MKNNSNGKTAILIEGARRIGKSHIALEVAKNNGSSKSSGYKYLIITLLTGNETNSLFIIIPISEPALTIL